MKDLWIIFGCWAVSFLFNGIEAGLMSIDPVRLRHNVNLRVPAAVRLDRLLKSPERLLVTVLLITNFADIIALILLARHFVSQIGAMGFVVTVIVAIPVYLFVLGVLPKSLFRRFPFRALAALSRLLEVSVALLWPVLVVGETIGHLLLPKPAKKSARLFAAREELKQITAQSEREGSITATERKMIHNVVDFQDVTARDVMKPLSKIENLGPDSTVEEALDLSRATGFDRFPVIDHKGEAIGLINV